MNIRKYVIILLIIIFIPIIFFKYQNISRPIEELNIPVGIGFDIEKLASGAILKKVPISMYVFQQEQKVLSKVYTGEGYNLPETRENRQIKSNKKFTLGQEKIYLTSEEYAKLGIRESVETTFISPLVSDTGYDIICKGKSEDILKYKIEGYPSSSDYIFGIMDNLKTYNFFGENYKIIDTYLELDAEGKNVVMPYLELKDSGLEVTGMAIFNKDKMAYKLDMDETRMLNILREDKSRGILTLQLSDNKVTSIESRVKRKAKCYKKDGKYKFIIDLNIEGDLLANEVYKGIIKNPSVKKKVEDELSIKVKEMCNEFIHKVQNDYKIDVFELGSVAVAKYGRHKGIDWNKVVSDSDIEVNVKINIDRFGRGDY